MDQTNTMSASVVWTPEDVAGYLRISTSTAYALFRHPDFPAINLGGRRRLILRTKFLDWVSNGGFRPNQE